MRKPHYWKTAGASSSPSELIVVDTETYYGADTLVDNVECHTLRIGCALAYRYEHGRRTRRATLTFRDAAEFWGLVFNRLSRSRPVWVIGHNLPYDLGILKGWKLICGGEYQHERTCVNGSMFYIKGTYKGCGLNFLDTVNYYHCSLASIGKSVGCPKLPMPPPEAPDSDWETYCRNDVEVTARGIENVIDFRRDNVLGPFQPTIASSAFAAFRSRFNREKVLVHTYDHVLKLEREAYYGGIVDTAFVGSVPSGEIYELDVCSMYPSVCRYELPVKYLGFSRRMGVADIKKLAERFIVFADVTIQDTKTPYPVKEKLGTYFPIGTFRTSLPHPELMDAIQRRVVSQVHRVSWYTKAPLFKEYMEFFVSHKVKYQEEGKEAYSNMCKLFANSLYGKCGQKTPRWQKWGTEALQILEQRYGLGEGALSKYYDSPPDVYDWESYHKLDGLPELVECRSYYGELELKVGDYESRDSVPSIAACVTSYARILLRNCQHVAGRRNWYYSDTDSLWVNREGMQNLDNAGLIRHQTLGYLDFKDVHFWLNVYGPKDYETDYVLKRKGVRINALPTEDGRWEQLQFPSALTQIADESDGVVKVRHIKKRLYRNITRCVVMPDGFTRPLVYPSECPQRTK